MSDHLVSIVLPVHNQADHIRRTIEEYERALVAIKHPYEMILVVNGCRDNSLEVCRALADCSAAIRTVHLERGGWGQAIKYGLEQTRGDLLCYGNVARTTPRDMVLMLMYALAYPDVVIKANRKLRDSWKRRVGSLLFNLECRALFDLATWDINGTPKVFPRRYGELMDLTRDDDLLDVEFGVTCRRAGYPMLEVPILFCKRHGGTSTTSYRSALRMYWGAFQLWRAMRNGSGP